MQTLKDLFPSAPLPPRPRRPRIPYVKKQKKEGRESEGEQRISRWLEENKIEFLREHSFPDCRNPKTNHLLYFDFYLPTKNLIFEMDGRQHFFKTEEFMDTDKSFLERQERDEVKNKYCADKGIKLIRLLFSQISVVERILKINVL